jgi:hypothetical protein
MPDISILKAAAERVSHWDIRHGVFANWQADGIGLLLVAQCGGESIEKRISWFEIEQARYPTHKLEQAEQAALAGLSN